MITADAFAELYLGEVSVFARGSEACPDDPTAGEYPVGHGVERHSTKLEGS
jgi:hypothetical protein